MWRICKKGIARKRLYGKVIAFIIIMLLVETFLPAMDITPAYAAGKTKNSVQLRIGGKKVTQKTYRMKQGAKKKLKAVVKKRKPVRFRSNNKNVVSVSKTGVIRAKKVGVAKITAVVKTGQARKKAWVKVKVVSSETNKKTDTTERPDTTARSSETARPAATERSDETARPTATERSDETARPAATERSDETARPAATEETDMIITPTDTPDFVLPVPTVTPILAPTLAPTVTPTPTETPSDKNGGKTLIVYFTRSGNTEKLADMIQDKVGGTKFRIETVKDYPEDYSGVYDEAMKEQQENARPALKNRVANMEDYDTVFVGYPIWHGDTPMAVRSFLENYDFTGKKVIPFCTSGSTHPETSFASVSASAHGAEILDGFWTKSTDVKNATDEVNKWIDGLGIVEKNEEEETMRNQMSITVGNTVFMVTLADNSSVEALKDLLRQGPLIINMSDYASMEKVGPIGTNLPRNDEHIITEAGDIILYQGNSLVIYYDTNTWNLTRIGKIEGVTKEQLLDAMGNGDVTVTVALVA